MLKTGGLDAERLARYRERGLLDRAAGIMRREGVNERDAFEQAVVRTVGVRNALTPEQFDAAYGKGAHDEVHSAAASQSGVDGAGQGPQGRPAHDGETGASVGRPEAAKHSAGAAESTEPVSEAADAKSTRATWTPAEERAPGPHQVDENASGLAPPRALLRDDHEQIVNKWSKVREPLPANAPDHRKHVIRGYRRELSKLGVLNAKSEDAVRNAVMDRQGERPKATEPEIIERTGAAPPGAPPPSATRTADLTEPRPAGGVFDSAGSATMPADVRSLAGARRMPTRVRDKAGGVHPASSNNTRGAPLGAVFDSGERQPPARPSATHDAGRARSGIAVKVAEELPIATRVSATTEPDAASPPPAVPRVIANKRAGDAFRDELAAALRAAGRDVRIEVYKPTPLGKRYVDIEVSMNGTILGGIEAKVGRSRYTWTQRLKDWWLKNAKNYTVHVVRDR